MYNINNVLTIAYKEKQKKKKFIINKKRRRSRKYLIKKIKKNNKNENIKSLFNNLDIELEKCVNCKIRSRKEE